MNDDTMSFSSSHIDEEAPPVKVLEPDQEICGICHQNVDPNDPNIVSPCQCNIYYCQNCILRWIETKNDARTCEICRGEYRYRNKRVCGCKGCMNECFGDCIRGCCKNECLDCTAWFILWIFNYIILAGGLIFIPYAFTLSNIYYSGMTTTAKVFTYLGAVCVPVALGIWGYIGLWMNLTDGFFNHKWDRYMQAPRNIKDWYDVWGGVILTAVIMLVFDFFQVLGMLFYDVFRGKEPFRQFRPTIGRFWIGVAMFILISLIIWIIGFIFKMCFGSCYKSIKNNCCVKVNVLTNN